MIAHLLGIINDSGIWTNSFFMQVKCYGPGLEPTGCIVNKPAEFTIDASGAGRGHLQIYAQVHFHTSPRCIMPHASLHWYKMCLSFFYSRTQKASPLISRSQITVTIHISASTYPPSPSNTLSSSPGERSMFPTVHSGWELTVNRQISANWWHFYVAVCQELSWIGSTTAQPFNESSWPHFSSVRFHTFPFHGHVRS